MNKSIDGIATAVEQNQLDAKNLQQALDSGQATTSSSLFRIETFMQTMMAGQPLPPAPSLPAVPQGSQVPAAATEELGDKHGLPEANEYGAAPKPTAIERTAPY